MTPPPPATPCTAGASRPRLPGTLFPMGPLVPTTPQVPDDDVVIGAAEA
jgi:hypothetical protein